MATIQCRACGYDGAGHFVDLPRCPRCGSLDCRAAVAIEDLPDDVVERIAAARVEVLAPDAEDRARVEAVMREFGIADANEARGWPVEKVVYLALEFLRTVPEHCVPAVDQAMRVLADIGAPPR